MRHSRERREQILIALAEGEADVDVLAQRFGVSPSTVRRDLQRLSKEKGGDAHLRWRHSRPQRG